VGLQVEHRQHTAIVTIDRPERLNAIDAATGDALWSTLGRMEADPDVWVIVLTGRGDRAFSAGHDLHEPTAPRDTDSGLASSIKRRRVKPSIAAVNGLALGAGLELVLACDLVIAADHATFGLPEARWGLIAGAGGLVRLPRRIPRGVAMEMALTGQPIDAARACELGLVNRVVARGRVLAEAFALAQQIVANGPFAVRASRQVIEGSAELAEDDAWRLNGTVLQQVLRSPEVAEGQAAFAAKRAPRWTAPESWPGGPPAPGPQSSG
jgi:enoyl-CoA hydratase/carnithine racemase